MLKQLIVYFRQRRYPGSRTYWERRYARGGHSGAGSRGTLARYKADVINEFMATHHLDSAIELGCGDGQQLALFSVKNYLGFDISPTAIERCRNLFAGDPGKRFEIYDPRHFMPAPAPLALSLEVIFHLTETDLYHAYLRDLFRSSSRWVIIFSGDSEDQTGGIFPHFKPRKFTDDISRLAPGWALRQKIDNPHRDISISDFYFYEKT